MLTLIFLKILFDFFLQAIWVKIMLSVSKKIAKHDIFFDKTLEKYHFGPKYQKFHNFKDQIRVINVLNYLIISLYIHEKINLFLNPKIMCK